MAKSIAEELAEQFHLSVCNICKVEKEITVSDLNRQIGDHFDRCCGAYPIWLTVPQIEKYRLQQEQERLRNKKKVKTLDIPDQAV